MQPYARALVRNAAPHGITIKVIAGLRTYEEQNKLSRKGAPSPGIVTNARRGFPNHNFGTAFDVGVFERANYFDESPKYKQSAPSEWIWDWNRTATRKRFWMNPTFNYARNGLAI